MHSTNYFDTFIEVAEDTKATKGEAPKANDKKKTVAHYEYALVFNNPYKYTSDDVFFTVYAERNEVPTSKQKKERELFFSKGRPCFRASPLTKTYGWGVHSNSEGKVAIISLGTKEYEKMLMDPNIKKKKAMRSKRK